MLRIVVLSIRYALIRQVSLLHYLPRPPHIATTGSAKSFVDVNVFYSNLLGCQANDSKPQGIDKVKFLINNKISLP